MLTSSGFSMPTKTLLDVDYYRRILADAPEVFLKVVQKNQFEHDLVNEMNDLVEELKKRRRAAGENHRNLLATQLFSELGLEENTEKLMIRNFSAVEDEQEEILTAEQQLSRNSSLDLVQSCVKTKHFGVVSSSAEPLANPLQKMTNICFMMGVHKRLVSLIEDTPSVNASWNLINPNQTLTMSIRIPILSLHKPPAADNNSNEQF